MSPDRLLLQLSLDTALAKDPAACSEAFTRYFQNRFHPELSEHVELKKCAVVWKPGEFFVAEGKTLYFRLEFGMGDVFHLSGCEGEGPSAFEVQTLREIVRCFRERMEYVTELKGLTYTDDLTGLYNQRYLEVVLDREISLAKRNNIPFSVLFLDLDYFKSVNDHHGHLIGSRLLFEVGHEIKKTLRESDVTFRYGGDEFVMILSHTEEKDALLVAERIRVQIEKKRFLARDGLEIRLTATIGVASVPEHAVTKKEILRAADEALYGVKRSSVRNKITSAGELMKKAANSDE